MAKNRNPERPPAPPAHATPTDSTDEQFGPGEDPNPATEEPKEDQVPEQAPDPEPFALHRFRVRSRFEGFREETLNAGDIVEAAEAEALPYLGRDGVLEPLED